MNVTRTLVVALAVPMLLLGGCSDDDGETQGDGGQVDLVQGQDGPVGDGVALDGGQGDDGQARDQSADDSQVPDGGPVADAAAPSCGAVTTFASGKTPQRVLHVATKGNDQTGDGSAGKPYKTIAHAAKQATPGTAVRVHAGTYSGGNFISGLAGSAAAPIWIGGAPGEAKPLISGGSQALHFVKVRYLVVHDLEVANMSSNGINCDDGGELNNPDATRYVVFRGLEIHDIGGTGNQDCLKLSGVDDYFVLDSSFARCGGSSSGSGVDHVGCHSGLIHGNRFEQMSGNAVQNKGGSRDIEIRANTLINAGARGINMGGSTGTQFFRPPISTGTPNAEARRIHVLSNLIVGSQAAVAFVGCVDCVVANNTIVDPGKWVLRILQESTTNSTYTFEEVKNGTFINNIIYFDASKVATTVNIGSNTQAGTFTFANNLWYAHDAPGSSAPTLPVTETSGIVGQDPKLDTAQGYRTQSASPAFGAGKGPSLSPGDIDHRCYRNPPAIGAYAQ